MSSTSDIAAKHQERKSRGLDLRAAVGPERNAGSGGREQRFERGSIFWHANTGAHEVHGGILDLYRAEGGPGTHPSTGRRHFGYPISDEEFTRDGLYPASRFEFGDILFVSGTGGVAITNEFRWIKTWYNRRRRHPLLGYLTPVRAFEQMARAS